MKSAEEWAKELQPVFSRTREVEDRYSETPYRIHVYKDADKEAVIKRIQLDAWRQGMIDAANIVSKKAIYQKNAADWNLLLRKHNEIMEACQILRPTMK